MLALAPMVTVGTVRWCRVHIGRQASRGNSAISRVRTMREKANGALEEVVVGNGASIAEGP